MSSYNTQARRKGDTLWEEVYMMDDYFSHHVYGVKFKNGDILRVEEVEFKSNMED